MLRPSKTNVLQQKKSQKPSAFEEFPALTKSEPISFGGTSVRSPRSPLLMKKCDNNFVEIRQSETTTSVNKKKKFKKNQRKGSPTLVTGDDKTDAQQLELNTTNSFWYSDAVRPSQPNQLSSPACSSPSVRTDDEGFVEDILDTISARDNTTDSGVCSSSNLDNDSGVRVIEDACTHSHVWTRKASPTLSSEPSSNRSRQESVSDTNSVVFGSPDVPNRMWTSMCRHESDNTDSGVAGDMLSTKKSGHAVCDAAKGKGGDVGFEEDEMEGTDLLHLISNSLDRFNAIVHPGELLSSSSGGSAEALLSSVDSLADVPSSGFGSLEQPTDHIGLDELMADKPSSNDELFGPSISWLPNKPVEMRPNQSLSVPRVHRAGDCSAQFLLAPANIVPSQVLIGQNPSSKTRNASLLVQSPETAQACQIRDLAMFNSTSRQGDRSSETRTAAGDDEADDEDETCFIAPVLYNAYEFDSNDRGHSSHSSATPLISSDPAQDSCQPQSNMHKVASNSSLYAKLRGLDLNLTDVEPKTSGAGHACFQPKRNAVDIGGWLPSDKWHVSDIPGAKPLFEPSNKKPLSSVVYSPISTVQSDALVETATESSDWDRSGAHEHQLLSGYPRPFTVSVPNGRRSVLASCFISPNPTVLERNLTLPEFGQKPSTNTACASPSSPFRLVPNSIGETGFPAILTSDSQVRLQRQLKCSSTSLTRGHPCALTQSGQSFNGFPPMPTTPSPTGLFQPSLISNIQQSSPSNPASSHVLSHLAATAPFVLTSSSPTASAFNSAITFSFNQKALFGVPCPRTKDNFRIPAIQRRRLNSSGHPERTANSPLRTSRALPNGVNRMSGNRSTGTSSPHVNSRRLSTAMHGVIKSTSPTGDLIAREHTPTEWTGKPPVAKWRRACSFYLRGHCKKEDCEFAHDLTKVTCKFWEMGECFKGTTCPFLHGYPPELENSAEQQG